MFVEVRTDHVDDKGVIHIDGYKTLNDNEEGVGIGYFIHGEVYWRDPEYQFDPLVKTIVEELKSNQPKFILDSINYQELKKQKEELMRVINEVPTSVDLMGILHLVDSIQDYAVDTLGKAEKEVFNLKTE